MSFKGNSCIYKSTGLLCELLAGSEIEDSIKEARDLADVLKCKIIFQFNGVYLEVSDTTDIAKKREEYWKGLKNHAER